MRSLRVRAGLIPLVAMEQVAHLDAAADQVLTRRVEMVDGHCRRWAEPGSAVVRPFEEIKQLSREAHELDHPEVLAKVEVRIQPPAAASWRRSQIDIGDDLGDNLDSPHRATGGVAVLLPLLTSVLLI